MMGASMAGVHGFALSLFCLGALLAPITVATDMLVCRQLERIVLRAGESSFRLRVACSHAIRADAFTFRRL
jgi:hypothetical protein